jgi:hypothetical protein
VKATLEFHDGIVVAGAAVDGSETVFVRELLDVRIFVTGNAPHVSVNGTVEKIAIDEKGYFLAISFCDEISLAMTHETVVVLLSPGRRRADECHQ